jgi:hypothetical protein
MQYEAEAKWCLPYPEGVVGVAGRAVTQGLGGLTRVKMQDLRLASSTSEPALEVAAGPLADTSCGTVELGATITVCRRAFPPVLFSGQLPPGLRRMRDLEKSVGSCRAQSGGSANRRSPRQAQCPSAAIHLRLHQARNERTRAMYAHVDLGAGEDQSAVHPVGSAGSGE